MSAAITVRPATRPASAWFAVATTMVVISASVTFAPEELDNRVDGLTVTNSSGQTTAAPPVDRPRIAQVTTETGEQIGVIYAPPACSRVNETMLSSVATSTMPCFPVYWTPPGDSLIEDWFNKTLVSQVSVNDGTGASSATGADGSQHQYRGYAQVTVSTGAAPDPVTKTVYSYLRGMSTDAACTADQVTVTSGLDCDWMAGTVLEADTYTGFGGSVDKKVVNGPWNSPRPRTRRRGLKTPAVPRSWPTCSSSRGRRQRTCSPAAAGEPIRRRPTTTATRG
jgi:hypothetical protein